MHAREEISRTGDLPARRACSTKGQTDGTYKNLPRGCTIAQLQALVGAGYASTVMSRFADGSQDQTYEITQLGLQARNSLQFFF
jgi:hypothetical protein